MKIKSTVQKNAEAISVETSKASGVFELTDLTVSEVSLVDRGANRREFLVKKKASAGARGEVITGAPKINPLLKNDAELAALDAADAGVKTGTVEASKTEAAPAAAPAVKEAPAVVAPVDEAAELAKLRAAVGPGVAPTKKADVTITPQEDGSVTVSVENDAPVVTPPVAPASVIEAVKVATLAGIDAISERLMKLRSDVSSGATLQNWSQAGQHDLWGQSWYLKDMIDQLCYIGGPMWEIEQAGDAAMDVDKSAHDKKVAKAHKAITAARLEKMRGIHKAMIYAHNDMDKLIKELDSEAGSATDGKETPDTGTQYQPDRGSSFAKAETVTAPVAVAAAVVKAADPELIEMKRSLAEQSQMVESLRQIVAEQSATINKSRTAQDSNSNPVEDDVQKSRHGEADRDNLNVKWPMDLADRKVPTRGRVF